MMVSQEGKSFRFCVVEFPSEADPTTGSCPVAVVSCRWVFDDEGKQFCWWPNSKTDKAREIATKNHAEIGPMNGSMCQINKKFETDNYDRAVKKLKQLEVMSEVDDTIDSDVSDEVIQNRPKSMRKKVSKNFQDFISSYASDDSDSLPHIPIVTDEEKLLPDIQIVTDEEKLLPHIPIVNNEEKLLERNEEPSCHQCAKYNDILIDLFRKQENLNKVINEKLDYITRVLQKTHITSEETENVPLPLKTLEELKNLDMNLHNEVEFKKYYNILKLVGGKDTTETTRRVCAKLISHNLALISNWSGRNGKPPFSSFTKVIQLIYDSVRANLLAKDTFSEKIVTNTIKVWLRGACDRDGGRTSRKKD